MTGRLRFRLCVDVCPFAVTSWVAKNWIAISIDSCIMIKLPYSA